MLQQGVAWYKMANTLHTPGYITYPTHLYRVTQWSTQCQVYATPAGCRLMEQSDGNPRNFMEPGSLNDPFPTTVQPLIPISQGGPEGHRFI